MTPFVERHIKEDAFLEAFDSFDDFFLRRAVGDVGF